MASLPPGTPGRADDRPDRVRPLAPSRTFPLGGCLCSEEYFNPCSVASRAGCAPAELLLWIIRVCYGAIIIGLSMAAFNSVLQAYPNNIPQAWAVFLGVLGVGLLIVLADL